MHVAAILKTFGLVSHNTWIEQKRFLKQAQHRQNEKEITSKENE